MDRTETHYEVLGLSPEATLHDIKKAFRHLVKVYHPDKKSRAAEANQERYLQIQNAFETLSDTRARQDYDNWLRQHSEKRHIGANSDDSHSEKRRAAVEQRFVTSFYKTEGPETTSGSNETHRDAGLYGSSQTFTVGQACPHASETTASLFRDIEPETTDLFRRLDQGGVAVSHSEGFEQWLRSRPASSLYVVNDDTILNSQGPALQPKEDELHRHQCTWPVSAIVGEAFTPGQNSHYSDAVDGSPMDHHIDVTDGHEKEFRRRLRASVEDADICDKCQIKATRINLKAHLDWDEVLVRVLHAPILPYDLVMIRDGRDVLGTAAHTEDERLDSWHFQKASGTNYSPSKESNDSTQEIVLGCSWLAEVVDVGRGVKVLRRGDYVIPLGADHGCWRAASVCAERDLMSIPKDAFPRTQETAVAKELFLAYYLLQEHTRTLRPGDAVLVNDAGCLVGQMIVQFCRLLGLRCICVVRESSTGRHHFESRQTQKNGGGADVSDYLRSLGAAEVFSPRVNVARILTKKRQSLPLVAFELSGGSLGGLTAVSWIARGGKVVLVHAAGMIPPASDNSAIPWNELLSRNIRLESFYLNEWLQSARNQQKMRSALESVGALVRAGKLVVDLAEPIDFTSETGVDGVLRALLALDDETTGSCLRQPILSFASLETERLICEEELQKKLLREQQARQAQESLFAQNTRNVGGNSTRQASEDKVPERSSLSAAATTDGEGLAFVELEPEQRGFGNRSGEAELAPLCVFAHDRGEVPEELRILLRHYRKHFKESFRGSHFVFPTGPFTCPVFPVEAVVCLGAPLLAERVLQFLVGRADSHAKQVKIFFLFGSKDQECPAWSQEEWRRAFEDRGYCVTRETIMDGTHETDDRAVAHVAAVFSILRLE
ncbi:UNVERIFIED_CONTAM: DnaJ domain-containing protein [Hammondia hammondi]|eukprot:XP_008889105.1 DnaJ domain-containing protein [Hammondia hammondi]